MEINVRLALGAVARVVCGVVTVPRMGRGEVGGLRFEGVWEEGLGKKGRKEGVWEIGQGEIVRLGLEKK